MGKIRQVLIGRPFANYRRIVEAVAEVLPEPRHCDECDPNGGCASSLRCRLILAEDILKVIDRERGV